MKNTNILKPHYSIQQLRQFLKKSKTALERGHWEVIYLASLGKSRHEISLITAYELQWIGRIISKYNSAGADGLVDKRINNKGAKPLLTKSLKSQLHKAILTTTPEEGLWDGVAVARWIKEKTGRKLVYRQRGWEYLVSLGFSLQTPRPFHAKMDPVATDSFKKN
jgi:transposase